MLPSGVAGITFSPDGKKLVSAITPQMLGLWDTTTGKEVLKIVAPEKHSIQGAAFSPDGRSLALDLGDNLISLCEVATGKERRQYGKKVPAAADEVEMAVAGVVMAGGVGGGGPILYLSRPAPGIAFSPDGKLLAQSRSDEKVSVWETATGKELGQLKGHQSGVEAVAFSPDGKVLTTGSRDTTALTWDVAGLSKGLRTPAAVLSDKDLEARWAELMIEDAGRAYDAVCALVATPEQAISLLKSRLKPSYSVDADRINGLIAGLDSDQFEERKRASVELEKAGEQAIPMLRQALAGASSPETRKRLQELLARATGVQATGEVVRQLRAIEVLQTINTPAARQVLQALAKGTLDSRVAQEAQAALERLQR
jgi:hypothetical protein